MCRTKQVALGSKEDINILRGWVKKGKAWAFELLGQRYRDGEGVKQSDKKAIEIHSIVNLNMKYHLITIVKLPKYKTMVPYKK